MDVRRYETRGETPTHDLSRRTVLGRFAGGGAITALLTAAGLGRNRAAAQDATPAAPAGWRTERLEVTFVPQDPVSIVRAGSGPPQRGDHFYIDAPIHASGDEGGPQIGTYQCFGAWTAAADDTGAPNQRLTTVHFLLDDGSLMGLINEGGADPNAHVGSVQGGTGRYTGALGTFRQLLRTGEMPAATPAATPVPAPTVVDAEFDLFLPQGS